MEYRNIEPQIYKYTKMRIINDFEMLQNSEDDGIMLYAAAAVAAAGPVLASCAPGPSEFSRPVI